MRIISQRPPPSEGFVQSLLTYGTLAIGLALLLWRVGPGRGPVGQDNVTSALVVALVGFAIVIFASRAAKVARGKTVHEVIDEGDSLLVRRGREQARILLSDIERVYAPGASAAGRWAIVLALRVAAPPFGREIIFLQNLYEGVSAASYARCADDKFVVALSERCRAARRARQNETEANPRTTLG